MILVGVTHERNGSLSYDWGEDATRWQKEAISEYGVRSKEMKELLIPSVTT